MLLTLQDKLFAETEILEVAEDGGSEVRLQSTSRFSLVFFCLFVFVLSVKLLRVI